MNCTEIKKSEQIGRYLLGELNDVEIRELEEHFFGCDACFEEVNDAAALRLELAKDRWSVSEAESRIPTASRLKWGWALALGTAVLGFGIVSLVDRRAPSREPDHPGLAELVTVEAPTYEPTRLRGLPHTADSKIESAMSLYQDGEYARAIPGLEAAAEAAPRSAMIHFFLGASYLMNDEPRKSEQSFWRVVQLGESVYLEEARYYRAVAYLEEGNPGDALRELTAVIELDGDLKRQATLLRGEIERSIDTD